MKTKNLKTGLALAIIVGFITIGTTSCHSTGGQTDTTDNMNTGLAPTASNPKTYSAPTAKTDSGRVDSSRQRTGDTSHTTNR